MTLRKTEVEVKNEKGRLILYNNGVKMRELVRGSVYLNSVVHKNGKWATCQNCGNRHAIGLRCAQCAKKPRPEVKGKRKPDNIKGI